MIAHVSSIVSSMKTRRLGSSRNRIFFPKVRRRATSGRSCSLAKSVFFEAGPRAAQKTPHSVTGHGDAALAQFGKKRMQGQIRLFGKAAEKKAPLAFQEIRPLAAHRLRRRTACRAGLATISQRSPRSRQRQRPPTDKFRHAQPERQRVHANRGNKVAPSMLASCSSMESESDDSRFGNPQRFNQNQKDSRAG